MPQKPDSKLKTLKTEHEKASDELARYKLLVDSIQDYAIFMMDPHGYIQTWNKGAQKNKGYTASQIIGKHFSIFYAPEDIAAGKPSKELEIATNFGRVEDEDWRIKRDGTRFWASVVITALRDPNGNLVGFAKVTRDLTDRKRYEDALLNANIQLKAQQKELQLLNESKDDFISLASHQLRTPATVIKQLLGLFVEGFIPDVAEDHMSIIKKAYDSNDRQIQIVNSLLKVAQVDAGNVKLQLTDCDINQLAEDVVAEFSDTVAERRQTIAFQTNASDAAVRADAKHLRMALENLVCNATKYTAQGGAIRIVVARKGNAVRIEVIDNGVGIAAQDIGNLFEKFRRLPNILSDEVGGTGLGLYWANKVISLHGGTIEVMSKPGRGSTFTINLPQDTVA